MQWLTKCLIWIIYLFHIQLNFDANNLWLRLLALFPDYKRLQNTVDQMNMRPQAEDGYNLRCELAHQTGQVSEAAGRNGFGTLKYGENISILIIGRRWRIHT